MRKKVEELREQFRQTELRHSKETLLLQQFKDNIAKAEYEIDHLTKRLQSFDLEYANLTSPGQQLDELLRAKINHHQEMDVVVSKQRQVLSDLQHQIQEITQCIKQEEQEQLRTQQTIQEIALQEQTLSVRAQGVLESLNELEVNLEELVLRLSEKANLATHEQELVHLTEKIKRLGAINLIAIEEYQTELERKTHLDNQFEDLIEALNTLELAIAKMDKETELRLKETFDQVNATFQAVFPRLFGGGHATLALTCDNLLDAGILVTAQPPGKRNSSIHLLSGGEKAMTAVALIFAIFQLNPSPFCMLDEVDAPLDDANIRRFCDLVKEMSELVQFLFITHNKVTMELAEHLIGVTMREPGVSRIVAVDVEEALSE